MPDRHRWTLPATGPGPRGTVFMGRVFHALMVVAAVEVGVALLLLPWAWTDYYRQHGELAVYITMLFVGNALSASLLLFACAREPRTWLLGGYFLVRATMGPLHMLPAFLGELPPPHMVDAFLRELPALTRIFVYLYVPAFHFGAAFLWAFARESPRVYRRSRLDDLARRMVPVSVAGRYCRLGHVRGDAGGRASRLREGARFSGHRWIPRHHRSVGAGGGRGHCATRTYCASR